MNAVLLQERTSDECGCPEEDWDIDGVCVTIHLEPDDSGHIFLDTGDWDDEKLIECNGIEDLRKKAMSWIGELPIV